ncbi:hypothetical protein LXL04_034405 [Taraxacum kok-saghyz]
MYSQEEDGVEVFDCKISTCEHGLLEHLAGKSHHVKAASIVMNNSPKCSPSSNQKMEWRYMVKERRKGTQLEKTILPFDVKGYIPAGPDKIIIDVNPGNILVCSGPNFLPVNASKVNNLYIPRK